jgi:diaphanous 1
VLASQTIISHIGYSLHSPSLKLRTLASELLAAICVLSPAEGHKAVLAAMSDFCVVYEEAFRFEFLIDFLRSPEDDGDREGFVGFGMEEEGVWDARTASMVLLNSISNCPEALEERVMLREEFSRRGLNEIIVVTLLSSLIPLIVIFSWKALRYVKPPDSLLKQLDVYTEEKFEDEEDIRERFRTSLMQQGHKHARSDSEIVLEDLIALAKQHGELYPMMVEILNHYGQILSRDVGMQVYVFYRLHPEPVTFLDSQLKADLFSVLDKFVEQAALIDNLCVEKQSR